MVNEVPLRQIFLRVLRSSSVSWYSNSNPNLTDTAFDQTWERKLIFLTLVHRFKDVWEHSVDKNISTEESGNNWRIEKIT
jgi:hypothetical protein